MSSDIREDEAAFWWDVPEFREYRSLRKFRTNQFDPWPSDAGLVEEFLATSVGQTWSAHNDVPEFSRP